jgi:uncharacterized membrane protein
MFKSIARLPTRDVLTAQFAGVVASPLTGLVRGLGSMIQGLALQLGQIAEKGLVTGESPEAAPADAASEESAEEPKAEAGEPAAEEPKAEAEEAPAEEPAAEEEPAEEDTSTEDSKEEEG